MSGRFHHFRSGFAADCAGKGFYARIFASSSRSNHALIPGVTRGRDNFLCRQHLTANGAVLALRLAGLGAGRRFGGVNHFGVTRSGNALTITNFFSADLAVCIARIARLRAGRILRIADLAVLVIAFPLSIERNVIHQFDSRTVCISRTGSIRLGIPSGKRVSLTRECICSQSRVNRSLHCLNVHGTRAAVGIKGNRQLCGSFTAPQAIGIGDIGARRFAVRLVIGAIRVLQLGGCDGNVDIGNVRSALGHLLGRLLCACSSLQHHLAALCAADDGRAALGCIERAAYVERAVDVDLRVLKACCVSLCSCSVGGGISDRHQLLTGGCVCTPLVPVIDIDIGAIADLDCRILRNSQRRTGQERNILFCHCGRTGIDIHGDIAVDGQNKI